MTGAGTSSERIHVRRSANKPGAQATITGTQARVRCTCVCGAVITLYRAPLSTNVERVALALAFKHVEVESVVIGYGDRSAVERSAASRWCRGWLTTASLFPTRCG